MRRLLLVSRTYHFTNFREETAVLPAATGQNRRAGVDEQIERCVQFALRGSSPTRIHDERRRHKRHPFPYPVRVFPVNVRNEVVADPIVVIGKHLTIQGFDFYFQQPVSHRRVIASFDCAPQEPDNGSPPEHVELLLDLTWCRYIGHGWYENGGRFLAALNPQPTVRAPKIVAHVEAVVASLSDLHA
jgi:hypothetical protein